MTQAPLKPVVNIVLKRHGPWGSAREGLELQPAVPIREDQAPEPPEKPTTKPGDVWILGDHRLICGDATNPDTVKAVLEDDAVDLVFTDPPYGVNYDNTAARDRTKKTWRRIQNDELQGDGLRTFYDAWLKALAPHLAPSATVYACIASKTQCTLTQSLHHAGIYTSIPLIWVKEAAPISWHRYHPQHEVILLAGEGAKPTGRHSRWYGPRNETTVWTIPRDPSTTYVHPTQKPVELAARAIRNSTRSNHTILDPFAGSGSTLSAAQQLNRPSRHIELDPAYCDVIVQRWQRLTGQEAHPA